MKIQEFIITAFFSLFLLTLTQTGVEAKAWDDTTFFKSNKVDFIQVPSTINDSIKFAVAVFKPQEPSPILLTTHGWHGFIKRPDPLDPNPYPGFLVLQVDMRGRKYSTGKPDCSGYELYDFYDAYKFAVKNYRNYISDPGNVHFKGGSGGGGNAYALLGKFPDLFVSAVISCGMSDYAAWFKDDSIGEFRDEMIPWIGATPTENEKAYNSRSGITTVKNILSHVFIIHGETDIRVPVSHARNYYNKARNYAKNVNYLELKGVGTRNHWGNISPSQLEQKQSFVQKGLNINDPPPQLCNSGELIVAGYIITKYFSVFLDSIDAIDVIQYNIEKKSIKFDKHHGKVIWHE